MSMPDEPLSPEEQLQAVLSAGMGNMLDMLAPLVRQEFSARLRQVLERNESIVSQYPEALDHLTKELVDAIIPENLPPLFDR